MIHPHTEVRFIDDLVGLGVFATAAIPRGTVTWVRDALDREFPPGELVRFDEAHREILDRYSYRNAKGNYVFCWDHTRYMNHSFRPNCLLTPYGLEIAIRDIQPGEEVTNDYGLFNIIEPFTPRDEGEARKEVRPDDLRRHSAEWDRLIAEAMVQFPSVGQPLARLLSIETRDRLRAIAAGQFPPESVGELLCRTSA